MKLLGLANKKELCFRHHLLEMSCSSVRNPDRSSWRSFCYLTTITTKNEPRRKLPTGIRYLSTDSNSTTHAFDRTLKRLQRDNAARAHNAWKQQQTADDGDKHEEVVEYDYFRQELAMRLVDRLDDIKREEGFPSALDIGKSSSIFRRHIILF